MSWNTWPVRYLFDRSKTSWVGQSTMMVYKLFSIWVPVGKMPALSIPQILLSLRADFWWVEPWSRILIHIAGRLLWTSWFPSYACGTIVGFSVSSTVTLHSLKFQVFRLSKTRSAYLYSRDWDSSLVPWQRTSFLMAMMNHSSLLLKTLPPRTPQDLDFELKYYLGSQRDSSIQLYHQHTRFFEPFANPWLIKVTTTRRKHWICVWFVVKKSLQQPAWVGMRYSER